MSKFLLGKISETDRKSLSADLKKEIKVIEDATGKFTKDNLHKVFAENDKALYDLAQGEISSFKKSKSNFLKKIDKVVERRAKKAPTRGRGRPKKVAKYETNKYKFYADGSHGWLGVKKAELDALGIAGDISGYSYQKGLTVYLEEDSDASAYLDAVRNKFGLSKDHKFSGFNHIDHGNRSPIRSYPSYKGTKKTAEKAPEHKAHYKQRDAKVLVDSNFLNMSQNIIPNSELKHMGMGEFYLQTPDGRIDFIRLSDKVDGFEGRAHRLSGDEELYMKLLDGMKKADKVVDVDMPTVKKTKETIKVGKRIDVEDKPNAKEKSRELLLESDHEIPRHEMPQVRSSKEASFKEFLKKHKVSSFTKDIEARKLKPTQKHLDRQKIELVPEMSAGRRAKPIIISSDGYILDGHHRWYYAKQKGENINVTIIGKPIDELIPFIKTWDGVEFQKLTDETSQVKAARKRADAKAKVAASVNPIVDVSTLNVIEEVLRLPKWRDRSKAAGGYKVGCAYFALSLFKNDINQEVVSQDDYWDKDGISCFDEAMDKGFIDEGLNAYGERIVFATPELKKLHRHVEGRLQTRKGVSDGTDLFPENANIPELVASTTAINRGKYKGIFGDFDKDGIPNADDPNPTVAGDTKTVEEVRVSDEIAALIDFRDSWDVTRQKFVKILEDKAVGETKVESRTKTPFSILNKLRRKRLVNDTVGKKGIGDIVGTRVLFPDHKKLVAFKKLVDDGTFGKFWEDPEDYYKEPQDGYRAYHWNVVFNGTPIELQGKTERMSLIADANHELYKTNQQNTPLFNALTELAHKADTGDEKAAKYIDGIIHDKAKLHTYLTSKKAVLSGGKEAPAKKSESRKFKVGDNVRVEGSGKEPLKVVRFIEENGKYAVKNLDGEIEEISESDLENWQKSAERSIVSTPSVNKAPAKKGGFDTVGMKAKREAMIKEVANRTDIKTLSKSEVLKIAKRFQALRSPRSDRDLKSASKKRVDPTPENLLRWMTGHGGTFDLIGMDNYNKDDATANLKWKRERWWKSIGLKLK